MKIWFQVNMSYIEIYNENIRDLLNPGAGALELRDEGGGAPVVAGLSELRATSAAHVAELLARGDRARTAEATHANQHSSRGHALLRYYEISIDVSSYLIAQTNPHWACVVYYGPFSLCAINKKGLCRSRGDFNRLMMMIYFH
jgi:hypothetical protein